MRTPRGGDAPGPRFRTVVFDVDSTLSGIEGVDWLASQCAPQAAHEVARLTDLSMAGAIAVHEVFGKRLELIRPDRAAVERLTAAYSSHATPGAAGCIAALKRAGIRVIALSGGFLPAVRPFCVSLGVAADDLRAVDLHFAADGSYAGFESGSPFTTNTGKADVLRTLQLDPPVLAVGDGMTDAAMREVADGFCAFTGWVSRANVIAAADYTAVTMAEVEALVLG